MSFRTSAGRTVAGSVVLATVLAVPAATAAVADPTPPATVWVHPVDGAPTRPFDAPASPYGPGHRGVDFAAPAGTPVRAAGGGVVAFAGDVAASEHVVVQHAGSLRTTYSYLSRVDVHAGDHVTAGEVVGLAGGPGPVAERGRLHFGLRDGERYLDPMTLFRPVDLAAVVHLAPVDGPVDGPDATPPGGPGSGAAEARALAAALPSGGSIPAWALASDPVVRHPRATARPRATATPRTTARDAASRRSSREECTKAGDASGPRRTNHAAFVVAGIDSSSRGTAPVLDLPYRRFGYRPGAVHSYSYSARGPRYTRADTWEDLSTLARRLAAQLRAFARRHPGQRVDVLAHSLGGLVVQVFLAMVYDPADEAYPPLGPVVLLSSPLSGAPAATAAHRIRGSQSGRDALGRLQHSFGLPPTDARSVRELDEAGAVVEAAAAAKLPEGVHVTSIGATDDVVVPATNVGAAGVDTVVVNPEGMDDHSRMLSSPVVWRAIELALAGRPPACSGLWTRIRAAVEPAVIRRTERGIGRVGSAVAALSDLVRRAADR
ncbi:MAG: peptidoglycan DD-metalloendopeptidase family protein [Acidimicrobiia bacterium]